MDLNLSREELTLLQWIENQPEKVSKAEMQDRNADEYQDYRIEQLFRDGYISREYVVYRGELVAGYYVSDKGRAALQAAEQEAQIQALNKRQQVKQNRIAIAGIVITVLLFLLGVLFDHAEKILTGLFSLLS